MTLDLSGFILSEIDHLQSCHIPFAVLQSSTSIEKLGIIHSYSFRSAQHTTKMTVPTTCCGRSDGNCVCAAQAKCSCGKQSALNCNCEKAATENKVAGARCSCRKCLPAPISRLPPVVSATFVLLPGACGNEGHGTDVIDLCRRPSCWRMQLRSCHYGEQQGFRIDLFVWAKACW